MNRIDELIKELCPDGVPMVKLGDVCEIKRGERITKKDLVENGKYKVISGGVGALGYFDDYNRDSETITVAQYGTAGYVGYQKEKFWANDVCYSLFQNDKIEKMYLYNCLIHKQKDIYKMKTEAIPSCLPIDKLKSLIIPLPPLKVQQEIVSILDSFSDGVDNIRAELELRRKQFEGIREELLTFGEDVPMVKLGDVCVIRRGASPRPIKDYISKDGEYNWIKIGDAQIGDKYIASTKEKITARGAEKSVIVKKGEFILSNSMSYGRPYIVDLTGCIHDGWLMISDYNTRLEKIFLYYLLSSGDIQRKFDMAISSGTVSNLNAEVVRMVRFQLPSLEVQQEIADKLDAFSDLITNLETELELRQKQFEYYREKLLTF